MTNSGRVVIAATSGFHFRPTGNNAKTCHTPLAEKLADAALLVGDNRPTPDLRTRPAKGNCGSIPGRSHFAIVLRLSIANVHRQLIRQTPLMHWLNFH
jgi:hypothetical protein